MKGGLIVNINSLAYQQPSANETIYCATKFALKGFSKALQMEAIGSGVEIIDVHPGGIQTNMTRDRKGFETMMPVSYTHLRAHETVLDLVCRLLLEKKK